MSRGKCDSPASLNSLRQILANRGLGLLVVLGVCNTESLLRSETYSANERMRCVRVLSVAHPKARGTFQHLWCLETEALDFFTSSHFVVLTLNQAEVKQCAESGLCGELCDRDLSVCILADHSLSSLIVYSCAAGNLDMPL